MKPFNKIISLAIVALVMTLIGCENNDSVAPDVTTSFRTVKTVNDRNIKILSFADAVNRPMLSKVTHQSKVMQADEGGFLWLFHLGDDTSQTMFVYSHILVQPNSMQDSAEIALTVDDQNFTGECDLVFAPHGTEFSKPALVTLYAYGVNLDGINPDSLSFYYNNEEEGIWEPMEYDQIYIDIELGLLYVSNAKLWHFSRYAIGYGD